ncbi:hypothetical protein Clacol_000829 [Clathrus columnatus]|uniref:F-box domain-containing protein n=1 Tax=Clathrus columnatus TaxID=1419009 RepID=A0AAV5A0T6_9AGAM|nr:hypothetical protein Clacol_000829 [Clathrus columnatus]
MSNYPGVAQRGNGHVCLHLSAKSPPPPIPFELQGLISADDWAIRVPALTKLASRYYKPLFERIWLIVSLLITLIIPLAAYSSIDRAIFGKDEASGSKAFIGRLIAVIVFFTVLAVFWVPIFLWKRIGTRRVNSLLASYAAVDQKQSPSPSFIPKWSMNTPGFINMEIKLNITTPPVAPVTVFHPDAYLPSFIGQTQTRGAYFYPYPSAAAEAGLPHMSVVGRSYAVEKILRMPKSTAVVGQIQDKRPSTVTEQHKILEETVVNRVKDTADDSVKLNTRVFINRLPIELFTHIIHFTHEWEYEALRHFVSYTWVCHHWRSVLVQSACFWTVIELDLKNKPINPFVHELLRRSKSAQLNINIFVYASQFITTLKDILAREGNRIHTLCLRGDLHALVSASQRLHFPSLRQIVYHNYSLKSSFPLLPVIMASDHLETLECDMWPEIPPDAINQLAPAFNHIQQLDLVTFTDEALQSLLILLCNHVRLRDLRLRLYISHWPGFSSQITFPELRILSLNKDFLLRGIQAPKLSSLNVTCTSLIPSDNLIYKDFDYSLIKYLYILGRERKEKNDVFSVVGLKTLVHPISYLSTAPENFYGKAAFDEEFDAIPDMVDILPAAWPAPGYFYLGFVYKKHFEQTLKVALPLIIPRLTSLSELCLASPALINDTEFHIREILTQVPSLERLIVPYGAKDNLGLTKFICLLNDTSLCFRLKYLSYTASYSNPLSPEGLKDLAEQVGKLLTGCVQLRRKVFTDALIYIGLGKFPPLPDTWLRNLKKLGTTVVTEKSIETIIAAWARQT